MKNFKEPNMLSFISNPKHCIDPHFNLIIDRPSVAGAVQATAPGPNYQLGQ